MTATSTPNSGIWRRKSPTVEPLAQLRDINTSIAATLRDGNKAQVPAAVRSALSVLRRALDPNQIDSINAEIDAGERYLAQKQLTEANHAYRRAVQQSRQVRGAGELRTLLLSLGWATVWIESGRLAEVEPFLLEVIQGLIKRCGAEHPITRLAQLCFVSTR